MVINHWSSNKAFKARCWMMLTSDRSTRVQDIIINRKQNRTSADEIDLVETLIKMLTKSLQISFNLNLFPLHFMFLNKKNVLCSVRGLDFKSH